MNNILNLTEKETEVLAKARAILGEETALRFLQEEMLWMLIDINKALRPYGMSQVERRREIIRRLGTLRVKLALVGMGPLMDRDIAATGISDAIKDIELEAKRRSERNLQAGSGVRP